MKLLNKLAIIVMAFILLLPYSSSSYIVTATEYKAIDLHFVDRDNNDETKNKIIDIKIWKISEDKNFENSTVKLKELSKFSNEELDKKYTDFSEHKTNEDGILTLSDFSSGYYYVREKDYEKLEKFFTPIILEIPNSNQDIFIKKTTREEVPKGGYKFKKISSKDQKALANAKFKVTKLVNGTYETVLKDGREYVVTSDEKGLFEVDGLFFGTYYLWEVDAPSGYEQLKVPIKFEVTDISKDSGEMIVTNKPFTPPPPILIPNTGDILFLVLLLGGIIIFSIGYRMTKSNN